VLEIHGSLYEVVCLDCGKRESRESVQDRILELNSRWFTDFRDDPRWRNSDGETEPEDAPDGDAELTAGEAAGFTIPSCTRCGGILKPDVVFFGDSVPKPKVTKAWEMLEQARSLVVLGSSLTVYSGFRFVDRAVKEGKPVAIINDGHTRGDPVATIKVETRLSVFFSEPLFSSSGDTF
jgi:NAD-dependent SIR2 family protein deacetylase